MMGFGYAVGPAYGAGLFEVSTALYTDSSLYNTYIFLNYLPRVDILLNRLKSATLSIKLLWQALSIPVELPFSLLQQIRKSLSDLWIYLTHLQLMKRQLLAC